MKFRSLQLLLILGLWSASCTHLTQLERAQDAFNQGSELELREQFGGTGDPFLADANLPDADARRLITRPLTTISPGYYYQLAYAEINEALKKKSKLEKDGLLGNAYALQALCAWKLGAFSAARQAAATARAQFAIDPTTYPRDEAVMVALDGLINSELAYQEVQLLRNKVKDIEDQAMDPVIFSAYFNQHIIPHYRKVVGDSTSSGYILEALRILQESKRSLAATHSLQTYLSLSQMATLKTWSDELSTINEAISDKGFLDLDYAEFNKWLTAEEGVFQNKRDRYLNRLAAELPGGKDSDQYKYWVALLGKSGLEDEF